LHNKILSTILIIDWNCGIINVSQDRRTTMKHAQILRTVPEDRYCYSTNRVVYGVPQSAIDEKKKNWREFHGYGYGEAIVSHPAWQEILDHAGNNQCIAVNIIGTVGVGGNHGPEKPGHYGTIARKDDGSIILAG
jgi:hypothetical protein